MKLIIEQAQYTTKKKFTRPNLSVSLSDFLDLTSVNTLIVSLFHSKLFLFYIRAFKQLYIQQL